MRQMAKQRNKKAALERELTIAIQDADSSLQEGKSPDAVRALIRRWRLIAFGNRGPAFRYSDSDTRLPRLARAKYVTLRQESRMCGGKSKRGARQLPAAGVIEVASLIFLPPDP